MIILDGVSLAIFGEIVEALQACGYEYSQEDGGMVNSNVSDLDTSIKIVEDFNVWMAKNRDGHILLMGGLTMAENLAVYNSRNMPKEWIDLRYAKYLGTNKPITKDNITYIELTDGSRICTNTGAEIDTVVYYDNKCYIAIS